MDVCEPNPGGDVPTASQSVGIFLNEDHAWGVGVVDSNRLSSQPASLEKVQIRKLAFKVEVQR